MSLVQLVRLATEHFSDVRANRTFLSVRTTAEGLSKRIFAQFALAVHATALFMMRSIAQGGILLGIVEGLWSSRNNNRYTEVNKQIH